MTGAHARLASLWDALESQGADVQRLPLHTITARTANRLAAREEYRLAVLAEDVGPAPRRRHYIEPGGLLNGLSTSNPQGCSSSDPHPVHRTIERMFILDTGEVA